MPTLSDLLDDPEKAKLLPRELTGRSSQAGFEDRRLLHPSSTKVQTKQWCWQEPAQTYERVYLLIFCGTWAHSTF